jgi:hypothetical protein
MTKKEWLITKEGTKVKREWPVINDGKVEMQTHHGKVIRSNFGHHQVLVRWESGTEVWHGRTQIELDNQKEANQ